MPAEPRQELKSLAKERSIADMRRDCARAFERASPYHAELRSIYKYMMPWRQTTSERAPQGGGGQAGRSITDYIFDGTSMSAGANFAGQMLADWMPIEQDFMVLEAGPFVPHADRPAMNEGLQIVAERIHGVAETHKLAVLEAFGDLFAGTGALFGARGTSRTIADLEAVPMLELALETGARGETWHHYWRRRYPLYQLPALWANGTISNSLARRLKESPFDLVTIVQYTFYDVASDRWRYVVWCEDEGGDGDAIWQREYRTCPWMTPKMFVVPGEAMGRGLAHLALPFTKTMNRARELALKAAVLAILGIWLRRNDGVFNPDTAMFDPGAFWTVASTGGALGPSIQRLDVPKDFDIASIVQQEERDQTRRVLLDDELPDEREAVRSATEVAGRLRRYARNRGGTGMRLPKELITPYVQHMCEIFEDWGHIPKGLTIDQLLTRCKATAPAAAAMRSDKVERAVNWIQMIVMLFGPQAALLSAKMEELLPEIGRWMGNDERFIRGKEETKELRDMLAQLVAAQEAASAKGGAAQQPPPPGQAFVNGGPH